MNQPFPTPPGFSERSYIDSGAIERPGFPDHGVIFTFSPGHATHDFDPRVLAGMLLEHTGLRGQDEDRFFTIVGGYYLSTELIQGVLEPRTEQVFGIALDRSKGFEISERGQTVLSDHWHLKNPPAGKHPVATMRERNFVGSNVPLSEQTGWTFIVVEAKADPQKYPPSRAPLAMWLTCPKLQAVQLSSSQTGEGTLQVVAKVEVQGVAPESFEWDWGDGSPGEITAEAIARHVFARPAGVPRDVEINVRSRGPGNCQASASAELRIPPLCPRIEELSYKLGDLIGATQEVGFQATVVGPTPDQYEWDWGDGSAKELTKGPEARHQFALPSQGGKTFEVKLSSQGPGTCFLEASLLLSLGATCPEIRGLSERVVATDKESVTLEIRVDMKGDVPDTFHWSWGDGSPDETTQEAKVRHAFQRPLEKAETFKVKVVTAGPGACSGRASTTVTITPPPVECPAIQELVAELEEATPDTQEVLATATLRGPAAERFEWDWGDGSPLESTILPKASHHYARSSKGTERKSILVKAYGPGDCETAARKGVDIPEREKPVKMVKPMWCRLLIAALGLLLGLSLSSLEIWYAGLRYPHALPDRIEWPLPLALGLLGMMVLLAGLWRYPGKRGRSWACPPTACDAYAISFMGFLAATVVAFYLFNIASSLWAMTCGLDFVLMGFSGYFWFRFCAVQSPAFRLLGFLAIAAAASLIAIFFVANQYLAYFF